MSVPTPSTAPPGTSGGPPTEPPYPWRLFVGMLLAILVGGAVLALAVGLNPLTFQRLGPTTQQTPITTPRPVAGGAVAAATAQAAIAPTMTPPNLALAAPTTVPSVASTSTPVTAAVAATPVVIAGTVSPENTVTVRSSGAGLDSTPVVPAGVDPKLANAVVDAYIRYWDARARATGDPFARDVDAELAGVMSGTELAKAQQSVADFRADGRVYLVHVDHQIQLQRATSQEALIIDQFTSTARKIEPDTRVPVDSQPVIEHRTDAFLLRLIDGTWKVVDEPET